MKKFAAVTLSLVMMITSVYANTEVSVKFDGEDVSFEGQQPVIENGRTLIPLRSIFEKMGYGIEWIADTKTAVLTSEDSTIEFTANSDTFVLNGNSNDLDVPAQIINGSMMLPLRVMGEASGLSVDWDNISNTVTLTSDNTEEISETDGIESEMLEFYSDYSALNKLTTTAAQLAAGTSEIIGDILYKQESGTLAASKGAEITKTAVDNAAKIYAWIDSSIVPASYDDAKKYLLKYVSDLKELLQIYNNEFNGVYPNEESEQSDFESVDSSISLLYGYFMQEIEKLDNEYQKTMYKYFDTDKDTAENKAVINEFVSQFESIAEQYPLPAYEDIFDDDGNIIAENTSENAAKIQAAVKGRKEKFDSITAPERCKARLELIKYSTDALLNLSYSLDEKTQEADCIEKAYCSKDYIDILSNIDIYDGISGLAADYKLGTILSEETPLIDTSTYADDEYKDISSDGVSQETADFVNNYYNMQVVNFFMEENDNINLGYNMTLDYDETITDNTKSVKSFFDMWLEDQDKLCNQLKNTLVSESVKDLKAAVLNYMDLDKQYTSLIKSYYTKEITESVFDSKEEALTDDMTAAANTYESEFSRLQHNLDNYLYDYLQYDMVRTDNAEVQQFGKSVIEINDKYPLYDDDDTSEIDIQGNYLTQDDVNVLNKAMNKYTQAIEKREAEYKNIDIPDVCQKRMEIILAADSIIKDFVNQTELKANDEDSFYQLYCTFNSATTAYDDLVYIATGGAEYLSDEEESSAQ